MHALSHSAPETQIQGFKWVIVYILEKKKVKLEGCRLKIRERKVVPPLGTSELHSLSGQIQITKQKKFKTAFTD